MKIINFKELLKPKEFGKEEKVTKEYFRNGVALEKGAVITKKRIEQNFDLYKDICEYWIKYPDKYLETIRPVNSKFKLKFFQKIFLRACLRKGRVLTIAPRAAGKTFICVLALYLICIFRPGAHVFQCSPGKAQGAKAATSKIKQLWEIFPLLKKEIVGDGNFGGDYVYLSFRNGSILDVMSPLNSTRGNRANCGILDEFRDHTSDDINEIIIPLLNVDRPMKNQEINPSEPQQVQLWISSASDKNTFCYDKTIELLELSIINPQKVFMWGFDFRVPVLTGLLSEDFLNEQKMSSTFSQTGFAKEYMSRFVGSSNEAWFDYDKLENRRKIVNPEKKEKVVDGQDFYYILSVDIARLGCQTVCTVLKVYPKDDYFRTKLVNIYILGKTESEKLFTYQALELKKLIADYNPKEVVIDINGVGQPFGDEMIKPTLDPATNITYPAYAFSNRKEYEDIQPKKALKILYGIKANADLNSKMHSALYDRVYSGKIDFLISEQAARLKLMATRIGQRMTPEERNLRLLPHQLTSILLGEILNLKIKPTGNNNQIAVEQINKRMTKDKFSALEMGVYRISVMESEFIAKRSNRGLTRKLVFTRKGR